MRIVMRKMEADLDLEELQKEDNHLLSVSGVLLILVW
jgi:hypothetical protein